MSEKLSDEILYLKKKWLQFNKRINDLKAQELGEDETYLIELRDKKIISAKLIYKITP